MTEFISPPIVASIPKFIQEDYPAFVKFIRDYFAFLEQDQGFLRILEDWRFNREPSNNVQPYIDRALANLGFEIAQPLTVPRSTMLHLLRDFYLARGTPQSFELLFKALFNEWTIIEYPRDQMFVTSAANYGTNYYVFITTTSIGTPQYNYLIENLGPLAGQLFGFNSKVTASVESVTPVLANARTYLQIEILKPAGEFQPGETVRLSLNDTFIIEGISNILNYTITNPGLNYLPNDTVKVDGAGIQGYATVGRASTGGVSSITITHGGNNYATGDLILASSIDGKGSGFTGVVSAVTGSSISEVFVLSQGQGYTRLPNLIVVRAGTSIIDPVTVDDAKLVAVSTTIGKIQRVDFASPYVDFDVDAITTTIVPASAAATGAVLTPIINTIFTDKSFKDQRGFLAVNCTLLDSDKFQQFSYSVRSPVNPRLYDDLVQRYLHPVGYVRVSIIDIESAIVLDVLGSTFSIVHTVAFNMDGTIDVLFDGTFEIERHSRDSMYDLSDRMANSINNLAFFETLPTWGWGAIAHPTGQSAYLPWTLDSEWIYPTTTTVNKFGTGEEIHLILGQDKYLVPRAYEGSTMSVNMPPFDWPTGFSTGEQLLITINPFDFTGFTTGEEMDTATLS